MNKYLVIKSRSLAEQTSVLLAQVNKNWGFEFGWSSTLLIN